MTRVAARFAATLATFALVFTPVVATADTDDDSASIAELELQIAQLSTERDAAVQASGVATEEYLRAQEALDDASGEAQQAKEDADEAARTLDEARYSLGSVAQQIYQGNTSLASITPFLTGEDFADSLHATAQLDKLGDTRSTTVEEFRALELIAETLSARAEEAVAREYEAMADLEEKAAAAQEAADEADSRLAAAEEQRDDLIAQLAAARQVAEEEERARQDQLEAERQERASLAAAESALNPSEEALTAASSTSTELTSRDQDRTSPTTATEGQSSASSGETSAAETSAAETSAAKTSAAPTSASPTTSATSSEPSYTVKSASGTYYAVSAVNVRSGPGTNYSKVGSLSYHEVVSITGTANGWYRIGDGKWVSGTYLQAGTPPAEESSSQTQQSSGSSSSSSVEAAVQYALAQVGDAYVWAGNGPDAWDCSGLTSAAFRQVGISIGRSASSQYSAGTKVPLSQAQRGDLLFWSSNGTQSGIYHVAIYLGNGQKVHAKSPQYGVQLDSVYYSNIMPYAVRLG